MHQHRTPLLFRLDDRLDGTGVSVNLTCCVTSQRKSQVSDPFGLREIKLGSLIGVIRIETIEVDDGADVVPVYDVRNQKPRDLAAAIDFSWNDDAESLGNNPIA